MRISVAAAGGLTVALLAAGCGAPGAGTPQASQGAGTGRTGAAGAGRAANTARRVMPTGAHRALHVIGFAVSSSHRSFAAVASTGQPVLTEVAPFWYGITATGALESKVSPTTVKWVKGKRLAVMPLFNNARGNHQVLLTPKARSTAVANIASVVQKKGYAGASIDFQLLPNTTAVREGYSQFLAQLGRRLHAMHKTLTANIIPTLQATASHGAYDEAAMAKSVDQIILMAYDRHASGSPPGPVAPIPWVRAGIEHAIAQGVRPNQLYLGVASYGYDWPQGSTNASTVGYRQIAAMHAKPIWDPASGEYHFTYTKNGTTHTVWYEGPRSAAAKVRLAKAKGLYGIAIWRLGYENAAYWTQLKSTLGRVAKAGSRATGAPVVGRPSTHLPTPGLRSLSRLPHPPRSVPRAGPFSGQAGRPSPAPVMHRSITHRRAPPL
jgi:spore germination protein